MKLTSLGIDGAWLAESPVWNDERGFFREWFKSEVIFAETGINFMTQQANISQSQRGAIRGIHYSLAPQGQAKWVTCVAGSIQDVVVDIRPDSKTFGQWIDIELRGDSGKAILISEGLGHGFLALEDKTTVAYLLSTSFSPEEEFGINPLDEEIGIQWCIDLSSLKISRKDKVAPTLAEQVFERKVPRKGADE